MLPLPPTAIATASAASTVIYASGANLHAFPAASSKAEGSNTGLIRKLALSADGTVAVSAGDDKTLRVWDVNGEITLRSTRYTLKRVACMSFTKANDILVTDKVGDVFLYPLEPREAGERAQGFKEQADPSLNPDADFLLGHVSTVSQHVLTHDGKRIITADRDEHIRVSRFPKSYVIDKYLWGSEGFVSAIHVPESEPNIVVAGGGEPTLQIFDWTAGALLRRVEIFPAALDYRRVRPSPRKIKNKKRAEAVAAAAKNGPAPSDDPRDPGFCVAGAGMMFPTGPNICIEKIDSVVVDGKTVIVFFAEGCTAVHAFVLPEGDGEVTVHSFPVSHPVLGFSRVPGSTNQLVLTVDATYGKKEAEEGLANQMFAIIEIDADGQMGDASASNAELLATLAAPIIPTTAPGTIAGLNLYPNLGLFPRWPGFEEDEELAGDSGAATPTPSEYEGMAPKQLGRLKAQGVDVSEYLSKKRRKGKDGEAQSVTPSLEVKP
ncbi:uncharacterized protein CcaverHIS019_0604810 [Cutaneotrichosporon cavernicola]|uniref:Transfer RNA methyltransferase 82 n=1 Tax=Cutaneotrichosporon cavernicola TaxID=279322 RepID=A0AA48QY26_9TREE|nr:uncharacterized protein CcaverHIS019_0604810 [Cutaneotrichosporon cavernicola]BEI94022.1 hypothetical protein CcaverHIS019_0604810 [Cutaneotrichosporon cavernicola]